MADDKVLSKKPISKEQLRARMRRNELKNRRRMFEEGPDFLYNRKVADMQGKVIPPQPTLSEKREKGRRLWRTIHYIVKYPVEKTILAPAALMFGVTATHFAQNRGLGARALEQWQQSAEYALDAAHKHAYTPITETLGTPENAGYSAYAIFLTSVIDSFITIVRNMREEFAEGKSPALVYANMFAGMAGATGRAGLVALGIHTALQPEQLNNFLHDVTNAGSPAEFAAALSKPVVFLAGAYATALTWRAITGIREKLRKKEEVKEEPVQIPLEMHPPYTHEEIFPPRELPWISDEDMFSPEFMEEMLASAKMSIETAHHYLGEAAVLEIIEKIKANKLETDASPIGLYTMIANDLTEGIENAYKVLGEKELLKILGELEAEKIEERRKLAEMRAIYEELKNAPPVEVVSEDELGFSPELFEEPEEKPVKTGVQFVFPFQVREPAEEPQQDMLDLLLESAEEQLVPQQVEVIGPQPEPQEPVEPQQVEMVEPQPEQQEQLPKVIIDVVEDEGGEAEEVQEEEQPEEETPVLLFPDFPLALPAPRVIHLGPGEMGKAEPQKEAISLPPILDSDEMGLFKQTFGREPTTKEAEVTMDISEEEMEWEALACMGEDSPAFYLAPAYEEDVVDEEYVEWEACGKDAFNPAVPTDEHDIIDEKEVFEEKTIDFLPAGEQDAASDFQLALEAVGEEAALNILREREESPHWLVSDRYDAISEDRLDVETFGEELVADIHPSNERDIVDDFELALTTLGEEEVLNILREGEIGRKEELTLMEMNDLLGGLKPPRAAGTPGFDLSEGVEAAVEAIELTPTSQTSQKEILSRVTYPETTLALELETQEQGEGAKPEQLGIPLKPSESQAGQRELAEEAGGQPAEAEAPEAAEEPLDLSDLVEPLPPPLPGQIEAQEPTRPSFEEEELRDSEPGDIVAENDIVGESKLGEGAPQETEEAEDPFSDVEVEVAEEDDSPNLFQLPAPSGEAAEDEARAEKPTPERKEAKLDEAEDPFGDINELVRKALRKVRQA